MLNKMLGYKLKYEVMRRFYLITKFKELFEICFTQKRLYQEFKSQHNKNSRTKTNMLRIYNGVYRRAGDARPPLDPPGEIASSN